MNSLSMAELKARGATGVRAALIFYELQTIAQPDGSLRTETGVPCTAAGLGQYLGYRPRAFVNSMEMLRGQQLLQVDDSGCLSIVAAQSVAQSVANNVANGRSATESVSENVADKTTEIPENGQLLSLPAIPEQRKQRGRIYSNNPRAIQKRIERYRKNHDVQNCRKVSPIMSQMVAKQPEMSPVANSANTNSLAVPSPASLAQPSATIIAHLQTLGIQRDALFQTHKPPPTEVIKQLDSLGIPHAYYSVLDQHYFSDGIISILNDLNRKYENPKYQQYFRTQNHTICTFLRWLITATTANKYGRITLNPRLTSRDRGQLISVPNPAWQIEPNPEPPEQTEQIEQVSDSQWAELMNQLPFNSPSQTESPCEARAV